MFRTASLSIIRSSLLYTQQWYMSYRFADSLRAGSGRNSFYNIHHVCVCSDKMLMMDRGTVRNMQSCFSKNKFEKLVFLVGIIVIIYNDAPSTEHQRYMYVTMKEQKQCCRLQRQSECCNTNSYILLQFISTPFCIR